LTSEGKSALADVAAARPRDFETRSGRLHANMRALFHTSPLDGVSTGPEKARDGATYLKSDDFRSRMKTTPTPEERSQIYQDTLSRMRSSGGEAAAQRADADFQAHNEKLATTMGDTSASAAKRDEAARALAFAPRETLSATQRDALTQFAKTEGSEAVRRGTLDQMADDGPIGKAQLAKVGHEVQQRIGDAIQNAPEGSELHRLGKLMRAQSLLSNDAELSQRARPGAREQLAGEIQKSLAGPAGKQIADIAARARKNAFGDRDLGKEQEAYLDSPAFKERLAVAGDDVKGEVMRQELTKLAAVDPERAQRVGDKLAREAIDERVTDELRGMNANGEGHHQAVQDAMTDVLKVGKGSAKVCKQIAKVMNDAAKEAKTVGDVAADVLPRMARQTQDLQNAMDAATKAGNSELAKSIGQELEAAHEAKGILQKAHDKGLLGSFSAAVGMHSLATKGFKFGNTKDAAGTASTIASVASGTDDMLKMSSWVAKGVGATSAGEMAGKAAKFLGDSKVFKALGPIGDALGAVSEGANAYKEYQCGDRVGAACSTAASLGYGGAAALGLTALALGSNPIGWAALAAGVGAMAVSWAGNHFGESDEESFLYRGTNDSRGRPMRLID
jgi:hypothetical protein